jgi:competence protein ComEC
VSYYIYGGYLLGPPREFGLYTRGGVVMKRTPCVLVIVALIIIVVGCGTGVPGTVSSTGPSLGKGNPSATPDLRIKFLNVGQGDACVIRWETAGKSSFAMVDAGKAKAAATVVDDLRKEGCTELKTLVVTHPHEDHIGGGSAVLDNFKVDEIWESGVDNPDPDPKGFWPTFENAVRARGITDTIVREGTVSHWGPATVTVLSPPAANSAAGGQDLNNTSVVLLLSVGKTDVLLGGDAQSEAETEMLSENIPAVEVFKVPHHGSSNGINKAFINKILPYPDVNVISVGPNSYGHPNKGVIAELSAKGRVLRTDKAGDIEVDVSPGSYWVTTEKGAGLPAASSN